MRRRDKYSKVSWYETPSVRFSQPVHDALAQVAQPQTRAGASWRTEQARLADPEEKHSDGAPIEGPIGAFLAGLDAEQLPGAIRSVEEQSVLWEIRLNAIRASEQIFWRKIQIVSASQQRVKVSALAEACGMSRSHLYNKLPTYKKLAQTMEDRYKTREEKVGELEAEWKKQNTKWDLSEQGNRFFGIAPRGYRNFPDSVSDAQAEEGALDKLKFMTSSVSDHLILRDFMIYQAYTLGLPEADVSRSATTREVPLSISTARRRRDLIGRFVEDLQARTKVMVERYLGRSFSWEEVPTNYDWDDLSKFGYISLHCSDCYMEVPVRDNDLKYVCLSFYRHWQSPRTYRRRWPVTTGPFALPPCDRTARGLC